MDEVIVRVRSYGSWVRREGVTEEAGTYQVIQLGN